MTAKEAQRHPLYLRGWVPEKISAFLWGPRWKPPKNSVFGTRVRTDREAWEAIRLWERHLMSATQPLNREDLL